MTGRVDDVPSHKLWDETDHIAKLRGGGDISNIGEVVLAIALFDVFPLLGLAENFLGVNAVAFRIQERSFNMSTKTFGTFGW